MAIARWNPFQEVADMRRRFERLFGPEQSLLPFRDGAWRWAAEQLAALDMYEKDDQIVLKLSLPGVKPDDIKITFSDHTLTVQGETAKEQEVSEDKMHRQERYRGVFTRTVPLPVYAKVDGAEATYESGVLTVTVPMDKQAQAKTIPVRVAEPSAPQKIA
jgi:HSP20 family protein